MKHVKKAGMPIDYSNWCRLVHGSVNEDYQCLQNPEKGSLHRALLQEQGWLCAYTMRRVDERNSHIEHIKPESLCRADQIGSDLDYYNLIACFPCQGMDRRYRYGAQEKGDWWENDGAEFVSPLNPNCERRFCFDLEGNIKAAENDRSAETTIGVLRLDHPSLTEDRRRVIQEFVYGPTGDNPISKAQAQRAIGTICSSGIAGRFHEFCVAINHALREHVEGLNRIATRRRFAGSRQG
jgi:uncharacterized protein (TIGR02646 family)